MSFLLRIADSRTTVLFVFGAYTNYCGVLREGKDGLKRSALLQYEFIWKLTRRRMYLHQQSTEMYSWLESLDLYFYVTRNMYTMLPQKWTVTLRFLSFSDHHLEFSVEDILLLNAAFCSRTIFRKSHKNTPLYLSRFHIYTDESDLGVTPPPSPPPGWTLKC